jgi:hypothetical protein
MMVIPDTTVVTVVAPAGTFAAVVVVRFDGKRLHSRVLTKPKS